MKDDYGEKIFTKLKREKIAIELEKIEIILNEILQKIKLILKKIEEVDNAKV